MKRFFVCLFLIGALTTVFGQSADEFYVRIYNTIREGDSLSANLQHKAALEKYREARKALDIFQKGNPNWNTSIVQFRMAYLDERIAQESKQVPEGVPETKPGQAAGAQPNPALVPALQAQVAALQDQLNSLQAERQKLELKLKEALSVQPASVDPRELAKAEQRIQALQKENDLLKVSLDQAKAAGAAPASPEMKLQLEKASSNLAEQKATIQKLTAECDMLQAQLKASKADAGNVAVLLAENKLLKEQLAAAPVKPEETPGATSGLNTRLATLEADKQVLELEKKALQARVQQLQAGSTAAAQPQTNARNQELENEVLGLRQQLAVLQAQKVAYTPEELALFRLPQPGLASPTPQSGNSTQKPSANTAELSAAARKEFAAGNLEAAEEKFQQVLKQDSADVVTLADLAAVQMERKEFAQAEENLGKALEIAPKDAFSLGLMGRLRFQQKRYDDALSVLTQAAALEPSNAEIQNYLGLVLSEKGLRAPAESALRKAIQLKPGYGDAHQNLAVVYLTQTPPLVELARYHYSKSLEAGSPKNPQLEQMLEGKK